MPAPGVAESLQTSNNRTTTEVLTTSAATAAGDTLVIAYASDFYSLATMPEVTSSAGTLTAVRTVDVGTNIGHIKTYTVEVATAGAKTVTFPNHSDADIFGVVLRTAGPVTVDVHGGQFAVTATTSHVAPSVVTTGADRQLVGIWLATDSATTFPADPYTNPAGMTERAEPLASPFAALLVCTQEIAASGATGSRTATFFQAEPYGAISIALAGASGGVAASGRSALALAGSGTARKVAAVTGTVSLAGVGAAVGRKVAPVSGRTAVAVAATGAARKAAPASGDTALAVAALGVTRKTAPAVGRADLIAAALATTRKAAPATGTTAAALATSSTVAKRAPGSGTGALALAGRHSQTVSRAVSGIVGLGLAGRAIAVKSAPASSVAALGVRADAAARKRVPVGGRIYVLVVGAPELGEPDITPGLMATRDRAGVMAERRRRMGAGADAGQRPGPEMTTTARNGSGMGES